MKRALSGTSQKGFTLIDALVAMAVLSVGVLGIAAMQTMAMGGNVDSNELSVASYLASDMLDRIRFNEENLAAYSSIDTQNPSTSPPITQYEANGDYWQWSQRLAASRLTNIRGMVGVTATGPTSLNQSQVTVTITWYGGGRTGTNMGRTRSVTLSTIVAPG